MRIKDGADVQGTISNLKLDGDNSTENEAGEDILTQIVHMRTEMENMVTEEAEVHQAVDHEQTTSLLVQLNIGDQQVNITIEQGSDLDAIA